MKHCAGMGTRDDAEEFEQTFFTTSKRNTACTLVHVAVRPGNFAVVYESLDLGPTRRLVSWFPNRHGLTQSRRLEHHQAALLLERRTGLLMVRNRRCVLRL